VKLSALEEENKYFTTFNGEFDARLSDVSVASGVRTEKGIVAGSARFVCSIKAKYSKDLMKKLNEGMILAVRNFKAKQLERYTLMEISRFWPEHFGLRGVSDSLYYPIQREIIEQSVKDWEKSDTSTMMIRINAVPINYDLIIENGSLSFENGWSFPLIGEKVWILNKSTIGYLFNKEVLKGLLKKDEVTIEDWLNYESNFANKPEMNPRIGKIQMFMDEEIPLLVNFEDLIRYHFGVFAFTGGGKSNLVANLIRKIFLHRNDVKVVVFDVSCEYIVLLLDLLCKEESVKVVLDKPVNKPEDLYNSIVKPKAFENEKIRQKIIEKIRELMNKNKIMTLSTGLKRTYSQILSMLEKTKAGYDKEGKHQAFVVDAMILFLKKYMEKNQKKEDSELTLEDLEKIVNKFEGIIEESKLRYAPDDIPKALRSWTESIKAYKEKCEKEKTENEITVDKILESLESDEKELIVLNIPDPTIIRDHAITITSEMLSRRKRTFKISPFILFVFRRSSRIHKIS